MNEEEHSERAEHADAKTMELVRRTTVQSMIARRMIDDSIDRVQRQELDLRFLRMPGQN